MTLESPTWEASNEYLSVQKAIERPEQATTLVTFSITATGDTPVAFRFVDEVSDSISPSAISFHADHKFESWTLYEDNRIAFADAVAPGKTLVAFYYLDDSVPSWSAHLDAPTLETTTQTVLEGDTAAEPPQWRSPDTATVSKDTVSDGPLPAILAGTTSDTAPTHSTGAEADADGEVTTSASAPDGCPEPAVDEAFAELKAEHGQCEYAEFSDDVERFYPDDISFDELLTHDDADRNSPAAESASPETPATTDSTPTDQRSEDRTRDDRAFPDDGVLAALLRELDQIDPETEEMVALREALDVETARHTSVQISHLQAQVADLTAYIDALEAFLDETGSATEVLTGLEDDLDSVRDHLTRLNARVGGMYERQSDLQERVEALEQDVEVTADMRAEVARVREESSQVSDRLDETERSLTRFGAEMETLSETVEDAVATHSDRLAALEETTTELQDHHETLRKAFTATANELSTTADTDT